MNSQRIVTVTRWALASGALAGIVLVYERWLHANQTTVALSLLLLILILAAKWPLRFAVAVSIAATACYNFFFLPPVGSFTVADPQNWLALIAFLATAIIASRLSQRARNQATEARFRQLELEVLFRLSREFLQSENIATLLNNAPSAVANITAARAVVIYLLEGDRLYQAGVDAISDVELPHLQKLTMTLSGVLIDINEVQVPLRTGVKPKGLLLLRGVHLSAETCEAIGGLISVAIDRAQALEHVARGEAAKESERLRTLMIDSITHELRTPLTSIKGAATALLSGEIRGENQHELLAIIDEESDRLNRLVSEAVEMAQLDAQQVHMSFVPVNVLQLVEHAREGCSWVGERHPIKVNVPASLTLLGDADFLQKVLCNLMENAAKYSEPDTPIILSAEQQDDLILISVADRGMGIESSEQSLIFERFYRARSHSDGTSGTGMGLAIARAIVEAHRGQISVTSQIGHGSVFTVSLPALQTAQSANAQ